MYVIKHESREIFFSPSTGTWSAYQADYFASAVIAESKAKRALSCGFLIVKA